MSPTSTVLIGENILNAALWAMTDAVAQLGCNPRLVLVDGNKVPPKLECASRAIVKGDAKCLSIAAASIVAKVVRDTMMIELARDYPNYGFERHKGYGTAEHHAAIERYGVTPQHRRSFKFVQLALGLVEADAAERDIGSHAPWQIVVVAGPMHACRQVCCAPEPDGRRPEEVCQPPARLPVTKRYFASPGHDREMSLLFRTSVPWRSLRSWWPTSTRPRPSARS